MTAPLAVEEGRLEDDTHAGCHRVNRLRRLPADPVAVLLVVVPLDGGDGGSARAQLCQVASLVLEASLADDVELAILAVRTIDQPPAPRARGR